MIELNQKYDRDQFLNFLKEVFLNDFQKDVRPVGSGNISAISRASTLGTSPALDLQVFEFEYSGSFNKRIALAKEAFQIMKQSATFQALAVFYSPENDDWRFSLMTANPQKNDKGNISVAYSNPRRYSFFLGPNAKVNTPIKFLIKKGMVVDFNDLKSRFSLEVVNKEFYKEISESFTKLVGGTRGEGRSKKTYEALLKLPSTNDHSQISIEFSVRLIGRVIFCWFLKEKISESGNSLMPKELLSLEAISDNPNYYHKILEPIFFEILNKPIKSRKDGFVSKSFSQIPYLNGGLFSPHDDDFFSYNEGKQAQFNNTVVVPDEWFKEFFAILETYNFTIDENTSIDEDLSIDPEMLGRIFENLLAEINPETGESARKSTGSYYTPRVIVDYMVDESLLLYLRQKTDIDEEKLRSIISYDLSDDLSYPIDADEKQKLVDAIEEIKILDPACGSGAYPIGALQKIVFILQQIDADGQIWFHKQIQRTSPEIRRVIEREFSHKNFDYIRKLGVIRENIYGIDIQPIATEISRLRCFLTLVVDERIDDEIENRGIEPLPNLDFKFVTANTLIGLPNSNNRSQIGLFEDTEGIADLREIREMFFNASGTEREMLKLQFMQVQKNMLQKLIAENRRGHADLTTMLTTWDPFSHKSSSWFDPEWMFGIKRGFDVVIANPPYVNIANISDINFRNYLKSNYIVAKNKSDLYSFFTERGYDLLTNDGFLSYIMSNSWLGTNSFVKFRKFLIEKATVLQLVKLPPGIFEAATVTTLLIFLQKNIAQSSHSITLRQFKEGSFKDFDYKLSYDQILKTPQFGFTFRRKISFGIKTIKLREIVSFSLGIKTSDDKTFVLDFKKDENTHKLLRGKDVGRYTYEWANKWIWYKPELMMKRVGAGPRKIEYFIQEKLLIKDVGSKIIATYDNENFLTTDTITILFKPKKFNIKFILGLLNSELVNYWFKTSFDAGLHIKINQLEEIPIPLVDSNTEQDVIDLVDKVTDDPSNHKNQEALEHLVRKIYAVSEEEWYNLNMHD